MFPGWTCPLFPNIALFILAISLAVVWSMAWKGVALWRAGRNNHLAWFICLFIFNTLGILEIVYIFAFSRVKPQAPSGQIEAAGG
jgi:hypothetical protein